MRERHKGAVQSGSPRAVWGGSPRAVWGGSPRAVRSGSPRAVRGACGAGRLLLLLLLAAISPTPITGTNNSIVEGVKLTMREGTVVVTWKNSSHGDVKINGYDVQVQCKRNHNFCGCQECQRFKKSTNVLEFDFPAEPDTRYIVRVRAGTTGDYSRPAKLTTNPEVPHVPDVQVEEGKTSVRLHWSYPCPYTGPASYVPLFDGEQLRNIHADECMYTALAEDKTPYTEYNFSLLAKRKDCKMKTCSSDDVALGGGDQCGVCYQNTTTTLPDVPSSPSLNVQNPDFLDRHNESRQAIITWQPPKHPNGVLQSYRLQYQAEGQAEEVCEIGLNDTSSTTQCQCRPYRCFIQLQPETSYTFQLSAQNIDPEGFSKPSVVNLNTTAGTPFFEGTPLLKYEGKDSYRLDKTFPININTSTFSDANGLIRKYEIYVLLECRRPEGAGAQPPVLVSNNPSTHTVPFIIGENRIPCGEACNPELESETFYCYYIRIHTSKKFTDSEMEIFTTEESPFTAGMVMAIIIPLLVLVLLVAGALFAYTRHFPSMTHSISMDLPMVLTSPPDINVERRILLSDLPSHVSKLLSYGKLDLRQEFRQLKSLCPMKPSRDANLPSNKPKNRYINILPFDETRVRLKEYRSVPCSDYINASYIHGFAESRKFIACQGPTDHYLDDFWRMVWEKNVHVIVMVTQCVENNKRKCSKYWPDLHQPKGLKLRHSNMKVLTVYESERQPAGYITRKLKLTKGTRSRVIKHFHYVSWPDMGCPQSPEDLITYVQVVKDAVPPTSSHVVVHCSAGVGRTGTFIGLSNLMDEMVLSGCVDVFNAVYRMRLHRYNMVQTEEQYGFLYKCVVRHYLKVTEQCETMFIEENETQPEGMDSDIVPSRTPSPEDESMSENSISPNSNGFSDSNHLNPQLTDEESLEDKDLQPQR